MAVAWKLHQAIETARGRFSPLKSDATYKPVFHDFVGKLGRLRQLRGEPAWPLLLAEPGLDDMLLALLHRFRQTP